MKVFLAIAAKVRGTGVERAMAVARRSIGAAFPVPAEEVTHEEWREPGAALLAWTNEPGPAITYAAGVSGYLADPRDLPAAAAGDLGLGGCYSLFTCRSAATGPTGADPVYHAETPELHVYGSRALLVHLVATGGRVEHDPLALQSMVRQGYFLSDETPFAGVRALPPGHRITAGRAEPYGLAEPTDLASALVASVRGIEGTARLTLTGGRDSRLIAATLHAAGIPFTAVTYGTQDNPDVILARKVARRLRVDHQVIAPKPVTPDDTATRVAEVLRTCEGMTSAYENVAPHTPFRARPSLGGHGGEILRGGFLLGCQDHRRKLDALFLGNLDLLTAEAAEHARGLAESWQPTPETLDHLYLRYRVGRWHAAARAGIQRSGLRIQPFLDHRVVTAALAVDPAERATQGLVHGLIAELAPALARVPFEARRWPWSKPAQKTPDWRSEPGDALKSAILGSRELAAIVRLDRVEPLLYGPRLPKPALVWHLATVATLLRPMRMAVAA
ncbi:MAG: hypothetical protein HOY71_05145 [Nonomuraea sp.]|nr:hypothetical protein [Nonomuraea sp.]